MMKNIIVIFMLFFFSCNEIKQEKNKSLTSEYSLTNIIKNKKRIDILFKEKFRQNGYYIVKVSEKYLKFDYKQTIPDTDNIFIILQDDKYNIILIKEQTESEDGNSMASYYFNERGNIFLKQIESFQFDNPCIDNTIKDLTYIKTVYYKGLKIINQDEHYINEKKENIPISSCTYNGETELKNYKSLKDFKENLPQIFK